MAESVLIAHGAMTIPSVRNEPLAMLAPISLLEWTWSANASTSFALKSVSTAIFNLAESDMTRCVSTSATSFNTSKSRMP